MLVYLINKLSMFTNMFKKWVYVKKLFIIEGE